MDYWRRSAGIARRDRIRNDIIGDKMQVKNDIVEDIFTKQLIWKSELLRNNRHHRVRTSIAEVLRHLGWEVHEEVHCISAADSNRRADIIAIGRVKDKAMVLDPTIRFERNLLQADEVNKEKQEVHEPCLPFLSSKYNIPVNQWVVKVGTVPAHCGIEGNELADTLAKKGTTIGYSK
ncbi:hypothetical protein ANN_23853 [Periplaneta americana]|uniref:RNase H type-1 domain-containing protein n=1 Tax=Periplaneta americana TaxID=6978 RepID=A0ABQ8SNF5_PERAM|nr:hypothetical protein ANN_23853 [Periplaneta americana]